MSTSARLAARPRAAPWLIGGLGAVTVFVVATVPLGTGDQAVLGGLTVLACLIASGFSGRRASVFLVALSLAVSVRYLVWRFTQTMPSDSLAAVLGGGLILAELYAFVVLAIGYLQTAWPLARPPRPLPPDPAAWPSLDVFVPTRDEPLAVVRATLLAAMAMDWPADRLTVWLLDDGGRDKLRDFAEQIGCEYRARADRTHAKAGNLNAGLAASRAAFVAVFDCDHIPTRAFLQLTMGWLVADPNLGFVQTPQHMYSPDPFQRNLDGVRRVPAEANLFHGLVQDGRDTFNACAFSGSGAVLRRSALVEIGGFATATVTEDAHTGLLLHRAGWNSAYLRLPLAAGLATERLARHVRQRRRWARGMIQMLRLDNPLFGPGLRLAQRLCYVQAAGHFLFPLPRLVFLTAPLAFLLLGKGIVAASPAAIAAYALPHLVHAVATSSRLQGRWRHSFWSEVYETVLALALLPVTLATLLAPSRGRFDVTAKGGTLEHGMFDLRATGPNLVLAGLLLAGLLRGAIGLALFDPSPLAAQALLFNSVWALFSLLAVLAALAVGREARQPRAPEFAAQLALSLRLPDGRDVAVTTTTLSQEGGTVRLGPGAELPIAADVEARFELAGETIMVPAHIASVELTRARLIWEPRTIEQEQRLIGVVFGRADAWSGWADAPRDRPWRSLAAVLISIGGLFRTGRRTLAAVAGLAVLLTAGARADQAHQAAPPGTTVRAVPQPAAPSTTVVVPFNPQAAPPTPVPTVAATPPVPPPPTSPVAADAEQIVLNLHQLGAAGAISLRGPAAVASVNFPLRGDEVVTAAQLSLSGAMSPALLPEFSNITVTLNDQYLGTVPANHDQQSFATELPVSPVFFQDTNRLEFRFSGRYTPDCNDPLSGLLWATVYDASTLTLTVQRLPPRRDLARLPLPLFDPADRQKLRLPVVLPAAPGDATLRAAAVMASWFGAQAGIRGAGFPVSAAVPAHGNAVVITAASDGPPPPSLAGLLAPLWPIAGPTVAVLANPTDPLGSILVVAGRTGEEAAAAAASLGVGSRALSGPSANVQAPALAPREPYDAPNWIATDRPVRLGELTEAADLQSTGYTGLLQVPFRTAPDFYRGRDAPFLLRALYRAPPGPIVDIAASRFDVALNGIYLDTFPLAAGPGGWLARTLGAAAGSIFGPASERREALVALPVHDLLASNALQFFFDARPLQRGDCTAVPGDLHMGVDPDSTLDLSSGIHFTQLPNLAFFVDAGFPFTRLADLSQTVVVVPERPSGTEIGVFLDLMGRMGAATGLAAARVAVTRPEAVSGFADRDLLMIGTLGHLGPAETLLGAAPLRLDGNRLALALPTPLDSVRRVFGDAAEADRKRVAAILSAPLAAGTALLVGGESTLAAGRSIVALLATEPAGLAGALETLRDPSQAPLVQGDLAILSGGRATSYRIGGRYSVGSLPWWLWPAWALGESPVAVAGLLLAGAGLLGAALFWGLRQRALARDTPASRPEDGPA